MKKNLPWLLWLWISAVIVGAFYYAPLAAKFIGKSSRILFFHVPMAWVSFVAFIAAAVWSTLYLLRGRHERHDRAAAVAIQLGLLFGVLAIVTGALWARIEWGAYWNWDPRQTSLLISLLFYAAYMALRGAVDDPEKRGRLAAAYALLGLVVTPFFYWIMPRLAPISLHPEPVVNADAKVEMDARIFQVLIASTFAFTVLFFWMHNLQCRLQTLLERKAEASE